MFTNKTTKVIENTYLLRHDGSEIKRDYMIYGMHVIFNTHYTRYTFWCWCRKCSIDSQP